MTNIESSSPYARVQMFSGGGYRFGYYLGSYAALYDHDLIPDLILATCGGSLASLLVDIAPEPQQLKLLMESETLYKVVRASQPFRLDSLTSNSKSSKPRYFYQALKRMILTQYPSRLTAIHQAETCAQLLAELNRYAMLDIDSEGSWLDELLSLKNDNGNKNVLHPDIAIIASRILPIDTSQTETNVPQGSAKLQQVLFSSDKLSCYLQSHTDLLCPTHQQAPQRIAKDIHIIDKWDIKQAVRASMADMYYLQPTHITNLGWCLGGVIDLTPIELAAKFADSVFAETKASYDKALAAPAIKRIFGFDPNPRLAEVLAYKPSSKQQNIHWLPFADNGKALTGQYVRKRINLRRGQLELIHPDYDGFVEQMQAQWQFGYKRTADYLKAHVINKF